MVGVVVDGKRGEDYVTVSREGFREHGWALGGT